MRFEWDTPKALLNFRDHGVTFGEATEVFYDPNAIADFDAAHSDNEQRFFIIGLSSRRLLYVVFAAREADNVIRIISARKAVKREKVDYETSSTGQ